MPQPSKGPRLGGGPAHERLMLANLATALFQHGRITTTEAKAKRLSPLAEPLPETAPVRAPAGLARFWVTAPVALPLALRSA